MVTLLELTGICLGIFGGPSETWSRWRDPASQANEHSSFVTSPCGAPTWRTSLTPPHGCRDFKSQINIPSKIPTTRIGTLLGGPSET